MDAYKEHHTHRRRILKSYPHTWIKNFYSLTISLIFGLYTYTYVSCHEVITSFREKMAYDDIKYEEEYITNTRGAKLFTCQWSPLKREPKALVFLCHGYAMECSISMRGTGTQLAKAGFAVHGLDYEGHGKSSGLQGYINSFSDVVVDCSKHFASVCEKEDNKRKRKFLLGESMGGAIVLMLHRKDPTNWDGAILVAPMCKIVEDMKPRPIVITILSKLSNVIPTWRIIPNDDIIDRAIKCQEWREEVRNNPYCYKGRPRLKTGYELFMASLDTESNLDKVSLPFLIVHGGDDKVTDPSVSELLYRSAASQDKTLKLYPGMWHALTSGESPDNIDAVFRDIIAWLDHRSSGSSSTSAAAAAAAAAAAMDEQEHKAKHDEQHCDNLHSS